MAWKPEYNYVLGMICIIVIVLIAVLVVNTEKTQASINEANVGMAYTAATGTDTNQQSGSPLVEKTYTEVPASGYAYLRINQ